MLYATAFMIMWHDIALEGEDEYHHWHTKEHMPERLSHPGFRRSRRGVNWLYDRQRYFTLYEGDELATFLSADYQRSLNEPTEWTSRMAPQFRNFLRCACKVEHSIGRGQGGAIATFRGRLPDGQDEQNFSDVLKSRMDELLRQPSVCGVHLATARPDYSSQATRETELRPKMDERPFDFVFLVESFGLKELGLLKPFIEEPLQALGCRDLVSQSYDVAFALERDR